MRASTRMNLWVWPSVTVLVMLVAGTLVSRLEAGDALPLFRGDAAAARTVLTALVGGLVTALSVIFSITLIGLQTVHSQYSPRLLRNFIQDGAAQVTLATFAGVSAFLLAVVRHVPQEGDGQPMPRLAILIGMLLFLVCVGVVAYYAQHITHSIRVSAAMDRVVDDALRDGIADADDGAVRVDALPAPPPDSTVVPAPRSGYLRAVDLPAAADLARREGVTVRLRPMVGDAVVEGTPLAWVWPPVTGGPGDGAAPSELVARVARSARIADDRTLGEDATFGLRQLVDVGLRAMSPSLNDPYTAFEAIDHLTVLLCRLIDAPLGHRAVEADGRVLAARPGPDLLVCVELACDQIRRHGAHEPSVALRLLALLRDVGVRAPASERLRRGLLDQVDRVLATALDGVDRPDIADELRSAATTAREWLHGRVVAEDVSAARL